MNKRLPESCTIGEAMIYQLALTIEDGILAFHGFGSPLVQIAMHLAKRSHAQNLVLVAGATYGINPSPPFITPTTNDWTMNRGAECHLSIEELFDLAARGCMGRMFLSGLQIDRYGNMNVTQLGQERLQLKLPGGGGGCNLSCDAEKVTIWSAAHRAVVDAKGRRRFRLVDKCDFITSVGHRSADGRTRSELRYRGRGPDAIVTELGVFDFDAHGQARLAAVYPDVDVETVRGSTGFEFAVRGDFCRTAMPAPEMVEYIRALDPLRIHERELKPEERQRSFKIGRIEDA
jgi:glutaconate CoA-transferase subunit B